MKSEFKSPAPSMGGALNFGAHGAAEISCFVRVLRHLGAGAPALSATANGGCSLHVHVNVANASAGGDVLSCMEVLNVYLSWVRFDAVIARFARPWMWREPSMAPLYATGSEFAWRETAWEQGHSAAHSTATYDIPTFLRAVRDICRSEAFGGLTETAKLERLFGRHAETPGSLIGRYCSLNLRRLTTYGTLEFRRFHGTIDDALIVRWAHFCVAFVECFRHGSAAHRLLGDGTTIDGVLGAIAQEQEAATAAELMATMAGYVHERTAAELMCDSGAE